MIRWICLCVAAATLVGCSTSSPGASSPRKKDDSAANQSQPPKTDKSASMTRAEFRKAINHIINGGNGVPKVKHLYEAFGRPTRTQNINRTITWFWKCKDGTVEVELDIVGDSFDEDNSVMIFEINDY
jgi:hypothetical protein